MSKHKKTVTIGIPAHNEAGNIARSIESILSQSEINFRIDKIIISCDGSTDNTAEIVREIAAKNKKVYLIDDGQRLGQGRRLNQLLKLNTSDIFVTVDADTFIKDKKCFFYIAEAFNDKEIGLVGGGDTPLPGKTFAEKVAVSAINLWLYTRQNINNGDSVHNSHGCILAFNKQYAQTVEIPTDIIGNDEFLYFDAISKKFKFKFVPEAVVYYRAPTTFSDYFRQSSRFLNTQKLIENHFGAWVNTYYVVPLSNKVQGLIKGLLKDHVYFVMAIAAQIWIRIAKNMLHEDYTNGTWESIKSTKSQIKI